MPTPDVPARWGWIGADAPGAPHPIDPPWRPYGLAVGMVVAVTIVASGLVGRAAEANLVMLYLLGTLPVALRGHRGAAVTAAVLGVLAFDMCFIPPYYTLAVSDTQYLFTFAVMGLVGGTIASLTARLVGEMVEARSGERRARALHELSRTLLEAAEPADMLARSAGVLRRHTGLPVAAWTADGDGPPVEVAPPRRDLTATELETLRVVVRDGLPAGPGTERLPGAAWLFVPVPGGALGALLDGEHEAGAVRGALETGANQIAAALGQARAREEAGAARRLAEDERVRSSILSAISHDLRTPLTGIVGAAATLAESGEALSPDTRRELAEDIREEGDRLGRLVTNLLQATRLEQGAVSLRRDLVPLDEIVAPVLASQRHALADRPLTVELPEGLPPAWVDPVLTGQIVANLLENACRHSPPGTAIALRARHEGGFVVVEVADAGPGLAPGDEAFVFERFRRGTHRGDGGVGLGLAIARGIVTAHGGTITAGRAPEGGALFRFTLPVAP